MNGHATELVKALNHIELHPEEWDQSRWFCGTKACLAGHICIQNGWAPIQPDGLDWDSPRVTNGNRIDYVMPRAQILARLSDSEADYLFHSTRTMHDLRAAVHNIDNDRAIVPLMWTNGHHAEHVWRDRRGALEVAAHRRTTAVRTPHGFEATVHPDRAAAYDYASDVATCRDTTYTHNDYIWEPE